MSSPADPSRRPPPNILFLFTDDQRYDTIHALGNRRIVTPAMDSLVDSGTAFTHAHIMGGSAGAVCMPSRAMLMTGRTLYRIQREGQEIAPGQVMLGEVLRRAGYATFGTGKWHNGAGSYARSFSNGAEIFFGGMEDHWNVPACAFDPTGRYELRRPVVRDPFRSNEVSYRVCDHVTPGRHSSELFADAAIAFLEAQQPGRPFFAYVSFMAPHDPRTTPPAYLGRYDPDEVELPPNVLAEHPFDNGDLRVRDELLTPWPRDPREIRRHIAEYWAMITHLDAQIGRVLDVLRRKGLAGDTIVVLAGDNGLALGQHGLMGKQNLYDHSVRVPLIFSGPGVPPGRRSDAYCYLLDVYPTLCALAGLPVPETVEGKSLVPAMHDPTEAIRDVLLCAYRGIQRSARNRRHKLIEYAVGGRRTTQLFDLIEDPWETTNLADDPVRASDLARLRAELGRWRTELGDDRPGQGEQFWGDA
jgi:arylsulfatase A-like enzyme